MSDIRDILQAKPGDKVTLKTFSAGRPMEESSMRKIFGATGGVFTIRKLQVGHFHSSFFLEEVTGEFNTVFFDLVIDEKETP